jgi:hypothetical protein
VRRLKPRDLAFAALGALAIVGVFVLLYAAARHAYTGDSDGATVLLEGHSMASGHPLLDGWAISLDSFWTIDALWNLVAVAIVGIRPALLYAVPAAIATATIAVGVVIAMRGRRRWPAAATAGATVVGVLAFPSHALARFFLRGPLHVGTALWCLVAFLAIRRGRFGWGFAVCVAMLAAGLLGDLQMLALGVVPVGLAGLAAAARTRRWRAGLPMVGAALASLVVAEVVRRIAVAVGSFSIAKANPTAPFSTIVGNLKHGAHEGLLLMGVGRGYYGLGGEPAGLSYTHLLAALVVVLAVAGGVVALLNGVIRGRTSAIGVRGGSRAAGAPVAEDGGHGDVGPEEAANEAAWRLDDLLVFACLASPAAFSILAVTGDPQYGRYLTSGIIFGAVLAGRVAGRVAEQIPWRRLRLLGTAVGLGAIGCYAAGTAMTLTRPIPQASAAQLAGFLEAHHLHEGYGAYWSASITTVQSDGRVEVRPVLCVNGSDTIVRYLRNSEAAWYESPPATDARFVVFQPGAPWGGVDLKTATHTFGPPGRVYVVAQTYEVLVWSHPLRLPRR